MNNDVKKWIWPAIALIIIVIVMVVWAPKPKPVVKQPGAQAFDPKYPPFIYGTVISAADDKIEFRANAQTLTAAISPTTKLAMQVQDAKTKAITIVDASIADFKIGSQIEVDFSKSAVNGVYTADKIQIIGQ